MNPAQRTPSETSQEIDRHIDHLNAAWDLRLPRLHGREAQDAEESDENAKKCSARIRALCWQGRANVDNVIADFEESAQTLKSEWVYKPQQEKGTLLSLPRTKSFISRETVLKTKRPLTEPQRRSLVKALVRLLDDEYRLLHESVHYTRSSSTSFKIVGTDSFENRTPASASFKSPQAITRSASRQISNETSPLVQQPSSGSVRRKSTSNLSSASKRRRTNAQAISPGLLGQQVADQPILQASCDHVHPKTSKSPGVSAATPISSLTSISSQQPPQIFSPPCSIPSSADTSILSESENYGNDTQHTDSTQLLQDALEDPEVKRSLTTAEQGSLSSQELIEHMSDLNPFQQDGKDFSNTLPPWAAWELYRYAIEMNLPPRLLHDGVKGIFAGSQPSSEQFREAVRSISAKHGIDKLPRKPDFPEWLSSSETYCDSQERHSMYFSAKLDMQTPLKTSIWQLTLLPMKVYKSCRFHRHWGADRFLEIEIPYFTTQYLPVELKHLGEIDDNENPLLQYLGLTELHIGGRTWRAFYLEKHERKGKKPGDGSFQLQRLHLFAIDGYDMKIRRKRTSNSSSRTPTSLQEFLQWHIPFASNAFSTTAKLFARMQLGLSKTTPTEVLEPYECISVPDMKPINADGLEDRYGPEMNDGCARISKELANAVWRNYCGNEPSDEVPSCFQARIGGCKGLWFVDHSNAHPDVSDRNFWIEITPAQCKIKPAPEYRVDADKSQLTFEVVKFSTPCQPAHLNIQYINVLYDRGVQRQILERLIRDDLRDYLDELESAMRDPDTRALRSWMQTYQKPFTEDFRFCGDRPHSNEDEVNMLLEHGFRAEDCLRLVEKIRELIKQNLDRYTDRMRILVPQSTTVYCIADPYRVLQPDQVQLNFSRKFSDSRTGVDDTDLEGKRVLVTRNPAVLPSDIQVAKAVFHERLRHLRDCIIFPTTGETPLAGKLSGGDYDGDTITVIWDQSLVDAFENVPVPNLPKGTECGLQPYSQFVRDVVDPASPTPKQTDNFMISCLKFNAVPAMLGIITTLHEQVIYSHPKAMSSQVGRKLAALRGHLVDASKQGWLLSASSHQALRAETQRLGPLLELAYKSQDPRPQRFPGGKCVNVIDFLRFDVADMMRDEALSKYEKQWLQRDLFRRDPDLIRPYRNACLNKTEAETQILQNLKEDLRRLSTQWRDTFAGAEKDSFNAKQVKRKSNWEESYEEFTRSFLAIEPRTTSSSFALLGAIYTREKPGKDSFWSQIRASCLYDQFPKGTMTWTVAGETLCRIKARVQGDTYMMRRDYRAYMKFDARRFRNYNNVRDGDESDGDDDVFEDAQEY